MAKRWMTNLMIKGRKQGFAPALTRAERRLTASTSPVQARLATPVPLDSPRWMPERRGKPTRFLPDLTSRVVGTLMVKEL